MIVFNSTVIRLLFVNMEDLLLAY